MQNDRLWSNLGCGGYLYILALAAPWFSPTIGVGIYLALNLHAHPVVIILISIPIAFLNYRFLLWFVRKEPKLFVLLGTSEIAVFVFWSLDESFNLDIYWLLFFSGIGAMFGFVTFSALGHIVRSNHEN